MSLHEQFKMDTGKETAGIEVKYAPNKDGSVPTFIIARKGGSNVHYAKALEQETRQYRRQIDLETLPNELAVEIKRKVFVNACLIGWSGIQKQDGSTLSFSHANALALFTELPELFDDLETQAAKASLFKDEVLDKAAKN